MNDLVDRLLERLGLERHALRRIGDYLLALGFLLVALLSIYIYVSS